MLDFFDVLLDTILAPLKIIALFIVYLFDVFGTVGRFFTSIFNFLPTSWLAVAGILVTFCILYKIFGRESAG